MKSYRDGEVEHGDTPGHQYRTECAERVAQAVREEDEQPAGDQSNERPPGLTDQAFADRVAQQQADPDHQHRDADLIDQVLTDELLQVRMAFSERTPWRSRRLLLAGGRFHKEWRGGVAHCFRRDTSLFDHRRRVFFREQGTHPVKSRFLRCDRVDRHFLGDGRDDRRGFWRGRGNDRRRLGAEAQSVHPVAGRSQFTGQRGDAVEQHDHEDQERQRHQGQKEEEGLHAEEES